MIELRNALWIELRKVSRSRIPLFTFLGLLMLPLVSAFLMFIYRDPEFARDVGLLSAKASLAGGSFDWPFYLSLYKQGIGIAGLLLFSLIISWVFGREFSDGTVKEMLAVPVALGAILAAKFIVVTLWAALLTAAVFAVGLVFGAALDIPMGSAALIWHETLSVAAIAGMVILVMFPIAFFASAGRGYLLPMGIALLILALANVVAVLGWGSYFPWSVPGMYAGMVSDTDLGLESYLLVAGTGLAGALATYLWWQRADQSR